MGDEDAMVEERGLTIGDAESGLSGASGWRVVDEETEELSRWSELRDDNDVVLEEGECSVRPFEWSSFGDDKCCERMLFTILSSLNGDFFSFSDGLAMGLLKSSTVVRIAVVISSRLVYGKQTFNTASPFRDVNSTALSIASSTSGFTRSLCPNILILAPYLSSKSPCCESCVSFILAISIKASTSYFDRLKFSILKAYMVTWVTPDL